MVDFVRHVGRDLDRGELVEVSSSGEDGERVVGRDPRLVSVEAYAACGHVGLSPMKVIRGKCLDCCGGSAGEVRKCTATGCPLWPYRMGENPFRAVREMSEDQRVAAGERLRLARVARQGC